MAIIKFVNEKKEIQVPDGSNLRKEALRAGVGLYPGINKVLNCHGFGHCGSCRVLITKGMENANPVTMSEKLKFKVPVPDPMPSMAYIGNENTMRLACQTKVNGDLEVQTQPPLNLYGENFFS